MKKSIALVLVGGLVVWGAQEARRAAADIPATVRADLNGDGSADLSDAIFMLNWLFQGGRPPQALAEAPDLSAELAALTARVAALEASAPTVEAVAAELVANHAAELLGEPGEPGLPGEIGPPGADGVGLTEEQARFFEFVDVFDDEIVDWNGTEPPETTLNNWDEPIPARAPWIRFTGCNIQIRQRLFETGPGEDLADDYSGPDGTGNLYIGWNNHNTWPGVSARARTGSHCLIFGDHAYFESKQCIVGGSTACPDAGRYEHTRGEE